MSFEGYINELLLLILENFKFLRYYCTNAHRYASFYHHMLVCHTHKLKGSPWILRELCSETHRLVLCIWCSMGISSSRMGEKVQFQLDLDS